MLGQVVDTVRSAIAGAGQAAANGNGKVAGAAVGRRLRSGSLESSMPTPPPLHGHFGRSGAYSWQDLSARRPLPIHFVLAPAKRSKAPLSASSPMGSGANSSASAANSTLTPAWACHVPAHSLSPHAASLTTIYRILDPEYKEPLISLGALAYACAGCTPVEALIRFADVLARPEHHVEQVPLSPPASPQASMYDPTRQKGPPGASLVDLSLAGLEVCTELWIPLAAARIIARSCGALEQLSLLLAWNNRHAWSLDEGEAGIIHNWRVPVSLLPAASYSLSSLLATTITAPVEILTRGTQVRTLISNAERQALFQRWRNDNHGHHLGTWLLSPSSMMLQSDMAEALHEKLPALRGDWRMRLPDLNEETLLRWAMRVIDDYDDVRHQVTSNRSSISSQASSTFKHRGEAYSGPSAVPSFDHALRNAIPGIRVSPNLGSLLLLLRDMAERIRGRSSSLEGGHNAYLVTICDGVVGLTGAELALLASPDLSSDDSSTHDRRLARAKADVMLVHFLCVINQGIAMRPQPPPAEPGLPLPTATRGGEAGDTPSSRMMDERIQRLEDATARMEHVLMRLEQHVKGSSTSGEGSSDATPPPREQRKVRFSHPDEARSPAAVPPPVPARAREAPEPTPTDQLEEPVEQQPILDPTLEPALPVVEGDLSAPMQTVKRDSTNALAHLGTMVLLIAVFSGIARLF